jgi:Ferritin-like domain
MTADRHPGQMPISESELTALTRDLDESHGEMIPLMFTRAQDLSVRLADASRQESIRTSARRAFLMGAGGALVTLALAACGNTAKTVSATPETPTDSETPPASESASPSVSAGVYTGDLRTVALATALENQAVGAYQAALTAAQGGKLGKVPPAVETFMKTAMSQHTDHAKAWNSALQGAGKPPITNTPLKNQKSVMDAVSSATDVGGVARLALKLENEATQSYLAAMSSVSDKHAIDIAASIAPVEAMHATILHFILGEYPVPGTFISTDMAASPSDLTI